MSTTLAPTLTGHPRLYDQNERRSDGREKVSGQAAYTADFAMPGMLWAAFVAGTLAARADRADRHARGARAAGRARGADGSRHRRTVPRPRGSSIGPCSPSIACVSSASTSRPSPPRRREIAEAAAALDRRRVRGARTAARSARGARAGRVRDAPRPRQVSVRPAEARSGPASEHAGVQRRRQRRSGSRIRTGRSGLRARVHYAALSRRLYRTPRDDGVDRCRRDRARPRDAQRPVQSARCARALDRRAEREDRRRAELHRRRVRREGDLDRGLPVLLLGASGEAAGEVRPHVSRRHPFDDDPARLDHVVEDRRFDGRQDRRCRAEDDLRRRRLRCGEDHPDDPARAGPEAAVPHRRHPRRAQRRVYEYDPGRVRARSGRRTDLCSPSNRTST